jgi:hypothetical protein
MIRLADPEESMRHPPRGFVPMLKPDKQRSQSQSLVVIVEQGSASDIEEAFAFNRRFVAVGFHLLTGGQRRSALAEGGPNWGAAVSRDPD